MNGVFPSVSYGLAGAVFLVLTLLLVTRWRGRAHSLLLAGAAILSALWAFGLAYDAAGGQLTALQIFMLEFMHVGTWIVLFSLVMRAGVGGPRLWGLRFGGALLLFVVFIVGVGAEFAGDNGWLSVSVTETMIFGSLALALYVLVLIEQVYRNARDDQRQVIKFLCLGVAAIFAYDLFLYSAAALYAQINDQVWAARGAIVAMCVPLIAVAVHRAPPSQLGFFVSRQIIFFSATTVGAMIYLAAIGLSGYYLRMVGGAWTTAIQLVFLFAAGLLLVTFLLSRHARSRLRVFIDKHFFENKYDYREEWLRLIETLTSPRDDLPLKKRGIKAVAQIVDAPSGLLWLKSGEDSDYSCVAGWNAPRVMGGISSEHALVRFLRDRVWIVDLPELRRSPGLYDSLALDDLTLGVDHPEYIVPLIHDAGLLGFVVLSRPRSSSRLNYEDHDLLRTAGQQIAGYLAQELSTEQLAESRQFEAFSRLTAYIMHDLKNLVAQQSLIVDNAEKHRSNPAFIDDSMSTIRGSVARMRRMIEHLHQDSADRPMTNVDLGALVTRAVSNCADQQPVPKALIEDGPIWVLAERERMLMALCNAIRNAQQATPADGEVRVELKADGESCTLKIIDSGCGMDEQFIRDRLFKPFDSTKGTKGMGIGAYQIRETLRSSGGKLRVESVPAKGTEVIMTLRRLLHAERADPASVE